jgi:hypothetical protein
MSIEKIYIIRLSWRINIYNEFFSRYAYLIPYSIDWKRNEWLVFQYISSVYVYRKISYTHYYNQQVLVFATMNMQLQELKVMILQI